MLNRGAYFLLFYAIILVVLVFASLQSHPWQIALQKIEQDVTNRFEVISARLLDTDVSIDRGVTRRARQRLPVPVGNVLRGFGVSVPL